MRTYDLIDDAFNALEAGQVDAVINDFPVLEVRRAGAPGPRGRTGDPDQRAVRVCLPEGRPTASRGRQQGARQAKKDGTTCTRSRTSGSATRARTSVLKPRPAVQQHRAAPQARLTPRLRPRSRVDTSCRRAQSHSRIGRSRWTSSSTSTSTSTSCATTSAMSWSGFWLTIQLSLVSAVLALIWGLVLALLRASPGRAMLPVRGARDRVHRHLARHPAAARDPPDRRQPAGAGLPADVAARSRLLRQAGHLLVRRDGDHAHLRRLLRRGLPRGPRGRALRADGGGPIARDEPRAGHAPRDRPAGRSAR